jgi:hypothetical protein
LVGRQSRFGVGLAADSNQAFVAGTDRREGTVDAAATAAARIARATIRFMTGLLGLV